VYRYKVPNLYEVARDIAIRSDHSKILPARGLLFWKIIYVKCD
jgi:hypothetical protein